MGWCGATEIMDAALDAAEAAVKAILDGFAPLGDGLADNAQARVDEALRPFVVTIAGMLRDGDWDCIEESKHYDRFAREMHGEDDREYETRLVEGLHGAHESDRSHWLDRLNKHREKVGNANGAG